MLKDQVQAEAEKAAQAIRAAMLEFNRVTGFEMSVRAAWERDFRFNQAAGVYMNECDLRVSVETLKVESSA
ncbi:hypothetical protein [Comamonas sp. B21-038]|uniref:hypothetical protein n=1 Tax=Comamonas sp. B21-038 TaxID=2918299 RepID=UPI001EFA52F5|nr:hypothetical protein [Comamonas sp. B21-038]ULR87406.1 hypothetical protein MJ205_13120 [Comamonas sp. B21-038]